MSRHAALVAAVALGLAAPAAARAAPGWLAGDLHVHTTFSHDSYGGPGDDNTGPEDAFALGQTVGGQFAVAATRRLDFLAITDHNDVRSQADPGFGSAGVLGLPGYENSLQGHAQMLGARRIHDNGDDSAAAVQRVAEELRAEGGVFQVNHPAEGSTSFPDDVDWHYGYDVAPDTVEVWNISRLYQPPLPSASSNDDAVGSGTTYCRNLLLVLAMSSALYLRADAPTVDERPAVTRAGARMARLGRRCRQRAFSVTVRGRSIDRVMFRLNGRRLRGAQPLGPDDDREAVAPAPRMLRRSFEVCARSARRDPQLTG